MATSNTTKTKPNTNSKITKSSKISFLPSMAFLKNMAKTLGVTGYTRLDRDTLVHTIQEAEGNTACYRKIPDCSIENCLFRPSCVE